MEQSLREQSLDCGPLDCDVRDGEGDCQIDLLQQLHNNSSESLGHDESNTKTDDISLPRQRVSIHQKEHQTTPVDIKADTNEAPASHSHGSTSHLSPCRYTCASGFLQWRWELSTWSLGTFAIAITLALLLRFKNRPLADWHSKVQITALVAIFSQVAQSALMVSVASCIGQSKWSSIRQKQHTIAVQRYDLASRGPEGALEFLFFLFRRAQIRKSFNGHTVLVILGALASLIMLSFGSFAQQSVAIGIRQINSPAGTATISRAVGYPYKDDKARPQKGPTPDNEIATPGAPNPLNIIDPLLTGAANAGASNNQSFSDVTAQCLTKECTWKPYQSLGICVTIEDVSSTIKSVPWTDPSRNLLNLTLSTEDLRTANRDPPGAAQFWMGSWEAALNAPDNIISEVYVVFFSPCSVPNNTNSSITLKYQKDPRNWSAFKGTFSLCLQTLNTSVANATTVTQHIASTGVDGSNWERYYDNGTFAVSYRRPGDSEWGKYHMDILSRDSISKQMSLTYNGDANFNLYPLTWSSQSVMSVGRAILGDDPAKCVEPTPDSGVGIYGFEFVLNNTAIAFTNMLRRNEDGNEPVTGNSTSDEAFIDVNLRWYFVPLFLWVMITLLLASTMISTEIMDMPAWKSSVLPLLECTGQENFIRSNKEMEDIAKSSYIQIKRHEGIWHLDRTN